MNDLTRRYFIMGVPSDDEGNALNICIGENTTQKYNLDETELLIKTTQSNIDINLSGVTDSLGVEYTLEQVKGIISGSTWQEDIY